MSTVVVQVEAQPAESRLPLATTAIAGLLAAALVAWSAHRMLAPMRLLPVSVRNFAAMYVLLTVGTSWGVTRGVLLLMGEAGGELRDLPLRVGLTAAWIAPTLLFLSDRSEWGVLALLALAISGFRLFGYVVSLTSDRTPPGDIALPETPALFASARVEGPHPEFFGAICAVLLMEESAAAMAAAKLLLATGLALLSLWVLWRCLQPSIVSAAEPGPPAEMSNRRTSFRLSAAALMTLLALLPHMMLPGELGPQAIGGQSYSLISALKTLLGLWGAGGSGGMHRVVEADRTGSVVIWRSGTVYPAVVVWSDQPHNVMPLVAPQPMSMNGPFGAKHSEPLTIRFDGQYLILRSADQTPGPDALVRYGSPAKQKFYSNDYRPLYMEARQNLGATFDLRCCRAIQLEITDADYGSRMVDMEIVLRNSQVKRRGSQTLGTQTITNEDIITRPVERTLVFAIPLHGLERFDEITVRYWLNRWHRFESARIAIKDFVLVPR